MSTNRTLASAVAITVLQQDVFSNAEVPSGITGVDLNLIQQFQTLLAMISSGERIDTSYRSLLRKIVWMFNNSTQITNSRM